MPLTMPAPRPAAASSSASPGVTAGHRTRSVADATNAVGARRSAAARPRGVGNRRPMTVAGPAKNREMSVELAVIGVPTSAGAHHAGQDRAPAALREHGFVDKLQAAGLQVT